MSYRRCSFPVSLTHFLIPPKNVTDLISEHSRSRVASTNPPPPDANTTFRFDSFSTMESKSSSNKSIIVVLALVYAMDLTNSSAQIVSHELRRLAVATNQFGIDALRALDKIEPPDKVSVFCPICLSSSLAMVMMGSSKYQVVMAMRQALYVLSMKPHEINRGFRDIFDHIDLNQHQLIKNSEAQRLDGKRSSRYALVDNGIVNLKTRHLSLPKLMVLKEFHDLAAKDSSRLIEAGSNRSISTWRDSSNRLEGADSGANHGVSFGFAEKRQSGKRYTGDLSQMSATSNIYVQRGLNMNYNYNLLLRKYYKTVMHPVDFVRNAEETRRHINSLVASNTEGKIKDLVKRDTFQNSTNCPRVMIISTFHFRGTLDVQLKNKAGSGLPRSKSSRSSASRVGSSTQTDRNQSPKNQLFIETEETLLKYGRFADLDCSVIEIPFNNRLVSLIIVMPNQQNSTELLLTKLSAQILSDMVSSIVVKKISIEIPVIKFDRGPINVTGILEELGLRGYFFSSELYSSESGLNRWMQGSDIVHETSIDIGTINPKFAHTQDRLKVGAHEDRDTRTDTNHIRLDKPFFYFVLDSINGLMLTMGRIR